MSFVEIDVASGYKLIEESALLLNEISYCLFTS
jgi:hypothetical protein